MNRTTQTMTKIKVFLRVFAVLLMLFMAVGCAEEERTDSSEQWKYELNDGGATITGYAAEPSDDLVIPDEWDGYPVTGIGNSAFSNGRFTSVHIPDSVTHIGDEAFAGCSTLERIDVGAGNPVYEAIDGILFDTEQRMLVNYPAGRTSAHHEIPEGTLALTDRMIATG